MGLVDCNIHGLSGFYFTSKLIYDQFSNKSLSEIICITYEADVVRYFDYYITSEESLSKYLEIDSADKFHSFLETTNIGVCIKCLDAYVDANRIEIIQKRVKVHGESINSNDKKPINNGG